MALTLVGIAVAHADVVDHSAPLPQSSYVRLEPSYTLVVAGGGFEELEATGLLVYHGGLVPGFEASRLVTGLGAKLTWQPGVGDLQLTQLTGAVIGSGLVGGGFSVRIPTLGGGVAQFGPAWFLQSRHIPHVDLAILLRSYFGAGGDRSVAFATWLAPTVVVKLPHDWSLVSDGEIEIDWLGPSKNSTVPVNLEVAHPIGGHFILQLGPEVDVAGQDRGNVKLDLRLDYLPVSP